MRGSACAALAAVVVVLAAIPEASAQLLYKWTDRAGRVVYSDKLPPKGFDGTVVPLQADPPPDAVPRDGVKRPPEALPAPDLAKQRRETRERLQALVDSARARLEAARAALEEAQVPTLEDRRLVQQQQGAAARPLMPIGAPGDPAANAVLGGAPATIPRPNCRTIKASDGKETTTCSRSILNEDYYARVEKLELAVREAEAQLDAAREAYRRGAD